MALRVLLADESTTIKKVMQLALQDFAVEVKSVHAGVDVLEVARSFRPDIVFADVLLQKKNGYDVCGDLKKDPELKTLPVVLMWSSFMDLDEKAYTRSGANERLEKPFDVEHLRNIVRDLVPKTQTQRLANFLKFPASFVEPLEEEERARSSVKYSVQFDDEATVSNIDFASPEEEIPAGAAVNSALTESKSQKWTMDSFEDISQFGEDLASVDDSIDDSVAPPPLAHEPDEDDQFRPMDLGPAPKMEAPLAKPQKTSDDDEPWSHQTLSRYKVNLPAVEVESEEFSIVFDLKESEVEGTKFLLNSEMTRTKTNSGDLSPAPPLAPKPPPLFEKDELEEFSLANLETEEEPLAMTKSRINIPIYEAQPEPEVETSSPLELTNTRGEVLMSETHPNLIEPEQLEPALTSLSESSQSLELEPEDLSAASRSHVDLPLNNQLTSASSTGVKPIGTGKTQKLNADELEEIIRSQSREIIESVVQRIVPDIASDLIRKELDRLLRESTEKNSR